MTTRTVQPNFVDILLFTYMHLLKEKKCTTDYSTCPRNQRLRIARLFLNINILMNIRWWDGVKVTFLSTCCTLHVHWASPSIASDCWLLNSACFASYFCGHCSKNSSRVCLPFLFFVAFQPYPCLDSNKEFRAFSIGLTDF